MLALLAAGALLAQSPAAQQPPAQGQDELKTQRPAAAQGPIEAPPEEDKSVSVTNYSFNPLQSQRDVMVGNEYYTKGDYHAAQNRFLDATKWNDQNGEAWRRLGMAAEKSKDPETAKKAYEKYLKLAPDAKDAPDIKKRLARLK
jgi:tetratricopeptide (TPR) repeat protein